FRFPEELENEVELKTQQKFLGRIFYDKNVEEYVLLGKSLLDLPSTSPAYVSIKNILKKAGY
ncbi:MAG: cobalamin biosynthesis protein, partial [Nitrososphaerota archaeon]